MPQSKPKHFFLATQSVDNRIGEMFSFVWASYAGFRELWWQVRGFNQQYPDLHINTVEKKFLAGLPLPGGVDFGLTFIESDWALHEQEYAKLILFETCTLFEGWIEKVCHDIFPASHSTRYVKELQFPIGTDKKGNAIGYQTVIQTLKDNQSDLMTKEFFPNISASKENCWPVINDYLIAYRYFKECRNAFIHSDGMATDVTIKAVEALAYLQSQQPNIFKHRLSLPSQIEGEKIVLNLRDCILFTTLVRRIIGTYDAALCVAYSCEVLLEERIRRVVASNHKWSQLPSEEMKYRKRIDRLLAAARVPEPVNTDNVIRWLRSKSIVS